MTTTIQESVAVAKAAAATTINNFEGGTVVITNPPFDYANAVPYKGLNAKWRKNWSRKFRLFGLYFYISTCRMKKRAKRDLMYSDNVQDRCQENRQKLYERQEHRCPHCGQEIPFREMEMHHILPLSRFPELVKSIRNGIMLCHQCHKEVHCNPWKNILMMKQKAEEMGIDLGERYESFS